MHRTQFVRGYLPPSAHRIKAAATGLGVDTRAVDAVQDLTALLSKSGEPVSAAELKVRVQAEARSRPLRRTEDGNYLVRETGREFATPHEAIAHQEKALFDYQLGMRDFMVSAARDPLIKGSTPLETALLTFKTMKEGLDSWNMEAPGSEVDEMREFGRFMESMMPQETLSSMRESMDSVKKLDQWERSMLLGAQLNRLETDKDAAPNLSEEDYQKIALAKLLDSDMRTALRISRTLRTLSDMNNPSFSRWQAKPDGDETAYRRMKSIGELSQVRSSAFALQRHQPRLFKHKLLNHEFSVRERGINRDNQQLLYVIIDGSGSMSGARAAMASGVLLNRLRSVVKGDAKLWFAMFDDSPRREHECISPEQAYAGVQVVLDGGTYTGGGTNIDGAIHHAVKRIQEKMEADEKLIRPEIVLVSDGDGYCRTTFEELQGIRFHAVMCHTGQQSDLRKLALASRGIYTHVD